MIKTAPLICMVMFGGGQQMLAVQNQTLENVNIASTINCSKPSEVQTLFLKSETNSKLTGERIFLDTKLNSIDNSGVRVAYYINGDKMNSMVIDQSLIDSNKTFDEIISLKDNWNGNGAEHFEEDFVNTVRMSVLKLKPQPEIFPTANNSIQIEYENDLGDYLEFEVFDDHIKMFKMQHDNSHSVENLYDYKDVQKEINRLYERSI